MAKRRKRNYDPVAKIKKIARGIIDEVKGLTGSYVSLSTFCELLHDTADMFFEDELYERAILYYQKAIELEHDPKGNALSYCHCAEAHCELFDHHSALDCYKRALMLQDAIDDKLLTQIYLGMAVVYMELGKYEDAIDYYHKFFDHAVKAFKGEEHPEYITTLASLAMAYWKMGDLSKFEEYFQQTVNLPHVTDEILANMYSVKANSLMKVKDWQSAIECLEKALEHSENEEQSILLKSSYEVCKKEIG